MTKAYWKSLALWKFMSLLMPSFIYLLQSYWELMADGRSISNKTTNSNPIQCEGERNDQLSEFYKSINSNNSMAIMVQATMGLLSE